MLRFGLGFLLLTAYPFKIVGEVCETCGSPDPPDAPHTLLQVNNVKEQVLMNVSSRDYYDWFSIYLNKDNHGMTANNIKVRRECRDPDDHTRFLKNRETERTLEKFEFMGLLTYTFDFFEVGKYNVCGVDWDTCMNMKLDGGYPIYQVEIDGGDAARIDYVVAKVQWHDEYVRHERTAKKFAWGVSGGGAWALSTQSSDGIDWSGPRPATSCWQFDTWPGTTRRRVMRCSSERRRRRRRTYCDH